MMWLNFVTEYGMFLLKAGTIVVAMLMILSGIAALAGRNRIKPREKITIRNINDKYEDMKSAINCETLSKDELKALDKQRKQKEKAEKQQKKKDKKNAKESSQKRIFALNFDGDEKASAVDTLREEITAILAAARPSDEVLVRVESAGGLVHSYGLAASQLQRFRDRKIPLTVAVDKVAASGGYLMACVANKIIAAPFAIIGSIGVVAELPNFNRLLKKHDIGYEQITSGEYKRTLSMFGENTPKGRKKMQEDVEEAHELFKKFIAANRPKVAVDKIGTGEIWYGSRALKLKLVDDIMTSDDYLMQACETAKVYEITYTIKKTLAEKYSSLMQMTRRGIEKMGLAKFSAL